MKIVLVEGVGPLFSIHPPHDLYQQAAHWAMGQLVFRPYIVVWGFVYGAAAMSSTALPLAVLFPSTTLTCWAIGTGILGFIPT